MNYKEIVEIIKKNKEISVLLVCFFLYVCLSLILGTFNPFCWAGCDTDDIDNSLTSKQMIIENPRIKKTQRISDRDGSWTSEYDSIYVGKHKDLKGEMIAIKNSDNATLLSVHKLNMKIFPEKKDSYDPNILNEILIE